MRGLKRQRLLVKVSFTSENGGAKPLRINKLKFQVFSELIQILNLTIRQGRSVRLHSQYHTKERNLIRLPHSEEEV